MTTETATGSQTATLDTEHTLHTETTAGVFLLKVDTSNLVAGDRVTLRIYTKTRSADGEQLEWSITLDGAQGAPNISSHPIPSVNSWKATLEQTEGTGRAFPWAVNEV